jgi:hypothetical protein
MASNENSCKLRLSEFDETFSDDVAENTKVIIKYVKKNDFLNFVQNYFNRILIAEFH